MNSRYESCPLRRAAMKRHYLSAAYCNHTGTPAVNLLSFGSDGQPPCVVNHYIPVARYWSDENRDCLSPYCVCFDVRNDGPEPVWFYVDSSEIPLRWLASLPIVNRPDQDLMGPLLVEATLDQLRGWGWVESLRNVVAWAARHGYPQADHWEALYDDAR